MILRIMISSVCFEHDLFGKPVPTFPDHALRGPLEKFVKRRIVRTGFKAAFQQRRDGVDRGQADHQPHCTAREQSDRSCHLVIGNRSSNSSTIAISTMAAANAMNAHV